MHRADQTRHMVRQGARLQLSLLLGSLYGSPTPSGRPIRSQVADNPPGGQEHRGRLQAITRWQFADDEDNAVMLHPRQTGVGPEKGGFDRACNVFRNAVFQGAAGWASRKWCCARCSTFHLSSARLWRCRSGIERRFWKLYMSAAYEDCVAATSTREAPWHVWR